MKLSFSLDSVDSREPTDLSFDNLNEFINYFGTSYEMSFDGSMVSSDGIQVVEPKDKYTRDVIKLFNARGRDRDTLSPFGQRSINIAFLEAHGLKELPGNLRPLELHLQQKPLEIDSPANESGVSAKARAFLVVLAGASKDKEMMTWLSTEGLPKGKFLDGSRQRDGVATIYDGAAETILVIDLEGKANDLSELLERPLTNSPAATIIDPAAAGDPDFVDDPEIYEKGKASGPLVFLERLSQTLEESDSELQKGGFCRNEKFPISTFELDLVRSNADTPIEYYRDQDGKRLAVEKVTRKLLTLAGFAGDTLYMSSASNQQDIVSAKLGDYIETLQLDQHALPKVYTQDEIKKCRKVHKLDYEIAF